MDILKTFLPEINPNSAAGRLVADLLRTVGRKRNNEARWAMMLILADALEDAGGDGRGWRWIAAEKRHTAAAWTNASSRYYKHTTYRSMPSRIKSRVFLLLRPMIETTVPHTYAFYKTRLDAEADLARAFVLAYPLVAKLPLTTILS